MIHQKTEPWLPIVTYEHLSDNVSEVQGHCKSTLLLCLHLLVEQDSNYPC
eukprot:Gb_30662 [translate_table: standard]